MAKEPDPIKKVRFSRQRHQTNKAAAARISNALGDLYRVRIHSNLTSNQELTVKDVIRALEHEYISLRALSGSNLYSISKGDLLRAKPNLKKIIRERNDFANVFVSPTKLLGSIGSTLMLLE